MTVVVIAEDAMSAGEVTEVACPELRTTHLAAPDMSRGASDVPRAAVSTASGTPGVPTTEAAASRVPAGQEESRDDHGAMHAVPHARIAGR